MSMPRVPAPAVLLYDWDNTLVDAWAGVTAALNVVFDAFGMPGWSVADARARIRLSFRDSFPAIFGAEWQRARDLFLPAMRERHMEGLRPMPEVDMLLGVGAILPQGVVSNRDGAFLRAEVTHLGWEARFGAVVGAGDTAADKPAPDPILAALARLGFGAGPHVWYLGDTALDMQAARAAGCTAVLLGDAGHDGGVARAGPDLHFADAGMAAKHLARMLPGRSGLLE
ncbi:MAG TPA: HAD family hydrolase [Acetobacteraceae bacterium]|nr:HAD family hydrolase [Acetobacteraceae bacterium]